MQISFLQRFPLHGTMKKMKRRILMTKAVLANHQSKTNNIVYLHDKLQKDLFRVLYKLYYFSKTNYGDMLIEKTDTILAKVEEIGRASCRERGWTTGVQVGVRGK